MYITAIYLGTGKHGYQAGVGAECETPEDTKELFESLRAAEVDIKTAPFLMDLESEDGEVLDSIAVSENTYLKVTGQPVYSEAVYKQIDRDYWDNSEKLTEASA